LKRKEGLEVHRQGKRILAEFAGEKFPFSWNLKE
jgi:hypothetical protein